MNKKINDSKKETDRKVRNIFTGYCALVLLMMEGNSLVFAAEDPLTVINNLSTFIFGLIRAIGLILLGFGIVQIGLSLKSHDPSQRANVRPDLGVTKVN